MPATPTSTSQRDNRRALGLRLPPSVVPAFAWSPWEVVERERGFHVSRESAGGSHEFLRNEVRDVKIFRKRELAAAACSAANGSGR